MTTNHYIERAKERCSLNIDEAKRLENRARKNGKRTEELTGIQKSYFKIKERTGIEPVLYQGYIFIYSGETCVTLYEMPEALNRKHYFNGKEQIRNIKKYQRFYQPAYIS